MSGKNRGIIAAILSAVLFGLMPITTKYLYSYGLTTVTVVFFRQILALPVILVLFKKSKKIHLTKKEIFNAGKIVIIGMLITQSFLYASYIYIPTGLATTLHYIYPTFVVLGMLIFYKAKITWVKVLCLVLCTSGIILFYEHTEGAQLIGMLIALCSGLTYAYYLIKLAKSDLRFMPPMQFAVLYITINSIVIFFFGLATNSLQWSFPLNVWIVLFLFAIAITIFAILLVQYSVKHIAPETVSILSTLEPITSIVVGCLWLNEVITLKTAIGMIFILSAVIIITLFNKEEV